jgi:mercuric transport protein
MMKSLLTASLCTWLAAPLWAAPRNVTLSLPTMDCAVCPITVKKALVKVDGVSRVDVNFDQRQAVVGFDDARTSVRAGVDTCHAGRRLSVDRGGGPEMTMPTLESILTCPQCGHARAETMPTDACQWFYECEQCHAVLRPLPGDCCVFCSYGTAPCPPVQTQRQQASSGGAGACCG